MHRCPPCGETPLGLCLRRTLRRRRGEPLPCRSLGAPPPPPGKPESKESLDDDLDSYFSGTKQGEERKAKKTENLDDDLDSYFAGKKSAE